MNIGLMISSAFITTFGLIFITASVGRKEARYFKKFLAFLAAWPVIFILLKLLVSVLSNPESVGEASTNVAEQLIAMIPENLISGYIGEIVGFVLWGIYRFYRWVKRIF